MFEFKLEKLKLEFELLSSWLIELTNRLNSFTSLDRSIYVIITYMQNLYD